MGGASSSGGNDTDVSGAEAVATGRTTYADKKIKGRKPADWDPEKDDTAAKLDLFHNNPYTKSSKIPGVASLAEPFMDAAAKKTREFFTNKVLESKRSKKNIGYTKEEFSKLILTQQNEFYKNYMSNRQSGATDAYGNLHTDYRRGSDGSIIKRGNNQKDEFNTPILTRAKNTYVEGVGTSAASPTGAEIDQATATTMSADETLLATNKKGRSQNILTSATGLGGTNLNIKKKTLG